MNGPKYSFDPIVLGSWPGSWSKLEIVELHALATQKTYEALMELRGPKLSDNPAMSYRS